MLGGLEIKKGDDPIFKKIMVSLLISILILISTILLPVQAPISVDVNRNNAAGGKAANMAIIEPATTVVVVETETTCVDESSEEITTTNKQAESEAEAETTTATNLEEEVLTTRVDMSSSRDDFDTYPPNYKVGMYNGQSGSGSCPIDAPGFYAETPCPVSLNNDQYYIVLCVVMREDGGSGSTFDGTAAVAQCVLQSLIYEKGSNRSFKQKLDHYGYKVDDALSRAESIPPNQHTKDVVYAVFYEGYRVTNEPIVVYYNPNLCKSAWHEDQKAVGRWDGQIFFKFRFRPN